MMGADGGTIATSGVVPEVIMALYQAFQAGRIDEAKRIQFQLLDLINTMLVGPNFPDGFRAGASLRGFQLGSNRQLLSPKEQADLAAIRGKIACILADCGFSEAAGSCRRPEGVAKAATDMTRDEVDAIVREILLRLPLDR